MKTILSQWEIYKGSIVAKDAGPVQIDETQKAFYAGAINMMQSMLELAEFAQEQGVISIQELRDECDAFCELQIKRCSNPPGEVKFDA